MTQPVFLVHYHEIGLKGRNRSSFERKLIDNISFLSKDLPVDGVRKISGRILVHVDVEALGPGLVLDDEGFIEGGLANPVLDRLFQILRDIPGVARVSRGWRTNRELDDIKRVAAKVLGAAEPFGSFKVRARRSNTDFPIGSMELNQIIGSHLCESFPEAKVQMEDPDVTVFVEVIQGSTYIYADTQPGMGGLPVGTAGNVIALLSTGIDSPVAMWRMIHRGAVAIALHFSGAPQTDDSSEYLVREICEGLSVTGGVKRLCIARIGDYQAEIANVVPPKLRVIFFRRLMFTVANEVARRMGGKAIVTGESLGQVASQTMENIRAVDAVAELPVFRPLIGTDKQEIIALAQRIGTFDLSTRACADCCTLFLPRSPETHAKMREVEEYAAKMDFAAWAREICDSMQIVECRCNR